MPTKCEARLSSQSPTVWVYLDALEGRLEAKECDAPTVVNVHTWLLFFVDDLVLTSKLEVGLQQQLNTLQQLCVKRGLTVNMEKKFIMFNFVDPCQEVLFKGGVIERVQTFKYLEILFKTTLNLDNVVEHLATTS
jgi:hypothetical protein